MNKLVIIGAGGHGKVVADCAEQMNAYDEICFLDDSFEQEKLRLHWPIIGRSSQWLEHIDSAAFIVAIGNNGARHNWLQKLMSHGAKVATIIHPSAQVSAYSQIGLGSVIFAGAVINCSASLGIGAIINTCASIDHDCVIGDACHISPGAHLAGTVTLGNGVWVGVGGAIIQGITVADHVQLGAGAIVTQSIAHSGLYVGIPAKKIK